MTKLKVGEQAPDFENIPDSMGKLVSLKDFKDKTVVLYFYPLCNSNKCIEEKCEFRDKYQKFIEAGAVVVGVISHDSQFISKCSFPFTLLTDNDSKLAKLYDINGFILPCHVTFIINKYGIVEMVHSALLSTNLRIEESLKIIEKLKSI